MEKPNQQGQTERFLIRSEELSVVWVSHETFYFFHLFSHSDTTAVSVSRIHSAWFYLMLFCYFISCDINVIPYKIYRLIPGPLKSNLFKILRVGSISNQGPSPKLTHKKKVSNVFVQVKKDKELKRARKLGHPLV